MHSRSQSNSNSNGNKLKLLHHYFYRSHGGGISILATSVSIVFDFHIRTSTVQFFTPSRSFPFDVGKRLRETEMPLLVLCVVQHVTWQYVLSPRQSHFPRTAAVVTARSRSRVVLFLRLHSVRRRERRAGSTLHRTLHRPVPAERERLVMTAPQSKVLLKDLVV